MATERVDSPAVEKRSFGVLIHEARAEKSLSLRRLASLSGIEFSRLARIEHGTRPAPDLALIRALAEVLGLELGDLLVAAGTSRSVVEELAWSERVRLGREGLAPGSYRPGMARLAARNTFDGRVIRRRGALCDVEVRGAVVRAISFSRASRLRLVVPPETVGVTRDAPHGVPDSAATSLDAVVSKARTVGQLLNLVLAVGELEINALVAADRGDAHPAPGDRVVATLLTAAIRTMPCKEDR